MSDTKSTMKYKEAELAKKVFNTTVPDSFSANELVDVAESQPKKKEVKIFCVKETL